MAKKKTEPKAVHPTADPNVMGLRGTVVEQPITSTLDENYMPYAMSVIVSRAIPEIDGFKPSHRKLLYTMYKMGLLTGNRTKSANIVGQTMRLNPHGDQAIYETMVRLAKGNESRLHPGGERHHEPCPLPGAQYPRRRGSPTGGGPGPGADVAFVKYLVKIPAEFSAKRPAPRIDRKRKDHMGFDLAHTISALSKLALRTSRNRRSQEEIDFFNWLDAALCKELPGTHPL